jgi:hypothetical protein
MWWTPTLLALTLLVAPAPAGAGVRLADVAGHLAVGYGKLLIDPSPGGSISLGAGLDYPVAHALRAGVDIGYDLFGSRSLQRGSEFATVDYSAFEAAALLHWLPAGLGPVRRISAGPALVNAHGDLSVTAGGATFSDLAVRETAGAAALQITLMSSRPALIRPALELGSRVAFLPGPDWTILTARVSVYY